MNLEILDPDEIWGSEDVEILDPNPFLCPGNLVILDPRLPGASENVMGRNHFQNMFPEKQGVPSSSLIPQEPGDIGNQPIWASRNPGSIGSPEIWAPGNLVIVDLQRSAPGILEVVDLGQFGILGILETVDHAS